MSESRVFNRPTLVLLGTAALVLGALLGLSLLTDEPAQVSPEALSPEFEAAASDPSTDTLPGAQRLVYQYFDPARVTAPVDEYGTPLPVAPGENFVSARGPVKSETITISIPLDGRLEYKAIMERGQSIVYSWETDGGDAYYDFHAHQEGGDPNLFSRYAEGESARHAGAIVAAYDGQHGWYWLNISNGPLTIKLTVAGFYERIVNIAIQ